MNSIVIPCYNEEKSIGICIDDAMKIADCEVIVVDNNSTDNSKKIITNKISNIEGKSRLRYVYEKKKGYGNAYRAGINTAKGDNVIFIDADYSYDFNNIPNIIKNLNNYDLVLGNRFAHMDEGAMHPFNKIGNGIIRFLFRLRGLKTQEVCTGLIGINRIKLLALNLKGTGMEYSSEVLLGSFDAGMSMIEIPINFRKRIGETKLKRFRDGLRHLIVILK